MMENPNNRYSIKTEQYDVDYDAYMGFEKNFGQFLEDGYAYTIVDRNTPRQWLQFMVNDHFASVAGNDGSGFTAFNQFYFRVTKYYSETDYLLRTLNGKRQVVLKNLVTGKEVDLLAESKDLTFTVKPGSARYSGSAGGVDFVLELFVPREDTCECWVLKLKSEINPGMYQLTVCEDVAMTNMNDLVHAADRKTWEVGSNDGCILAKTENDVQFGTVFAMFSMPGGTVTAQEYEDNFSNSTIIGCLKLSISKQVYLVSDEIEIPVVAGVGTSKLECLHLAEKYASLDAVREEYGLVQREWAEKLSRNTCVIPDKNLEYFSNVWLKNQLHLTMRYNRFGLIGYRDVFQDAWGHLLLDPKSTRDILVKAIGKMKRDGRCPRQFDWYSDRIDDRDFMDSPLWIPIALSSYLKETGDFSILEEKVGFLDSDEQVPLFDHIMLALEYLYHSRGKNGLILMRRGDWLDGLNGINQYGEATTVWGTMAAFHAQNLMAEICDQIGNNTTAALLRVRSEEYRKIVNDKGWDGNWYAYAFIDDEPIGSSQLHEGKIYLNPQSWAILTGIVDDEKKIERIYRSISTYLMSMYGPHLLAPPYTKYGSKCGRIQNQRPGTFANSAIYLHAAAFLVAAYCECGRFEDALDLIGRILPNHPDNCDTRRTSEPYAVGNVYYGVTHPCHGLNLYTWFTATPAWLLHDSFEGILGVSPEFNGLRITARNYPGWNEYHVSKTYRGTKYEIDFVRGEETGIWLDGILVEGNIVKSDNEICSVKVVY